jgi:hypothetical protein
VLQNIGNLFIGIDNIVTISEINKYIYSGCPLYLTRWAVGTFSTAFYSDGIGINANMAWSLIDFRRVFIRFQFLCEMEEWNLKI